MFDLNLKKKNKFEMFRASGIAFRFLSSEKVALNSHSLALYFIVTFHDCNRSAIYSWFLFGRSSTTCFRFALFATLINYYHAMFALHSLLQTSPPCDWYILCTKEWQFHSFTEMCSI